jgi:YD repeat-containing protein
VKGPRAAVASLALLSGCTSGDVRPDSSRADSVVPARSAPDSARRVDAHDVLQAGTCVAFPRETWTPARVGAATFVVNRATRGMAARVRWALAPDSSAMIVVEDPSGVENEAVPDGVLYATERTGRTWRMDSVWSAAPSPDWTRVAVGRAVVLQGDEAQAVARSRWTGAAKSLAAIAGPQPALAAESLRAHSYPVSGMAVAEGAAATFVADVARDEREAPTRFVSLDGWRVRWSCDGHDLLIGERPGRVQDDAPANTARRVAVMSERVTAAPAADSIPWTAGPTLDISVTVARDARSLRARGRVIEGRTDRITVRDSSASGWSLPRDVGPGVPLAVTRNGRFVLAIAPRAGAKQYESPDQAVVYRVP